MSQERVLQRRLRVLDTLDEVVGAMRAASAQHFREARASLPSARVYREEVEATLHALAPHLAAPPEPAAAAAVVLIGTDRGLCGDYTTQLAAAAAAARAGLGPGPLLCVGRRAVAPLARLGIAAERVYPAPESLAGIVPLLLPLADDLLALRRAGRAAAVELVAARFEGAGRFRPTRVRLLPVAPPRGAADSLPPSPYAERDHLAAVALRELLYVALHETLLDALAAEHGKRLTVAESARSWLEERLQTTRRRLASLRRERATQEVIEVAAGARMLRRRRGRARP